MYIIEINHKDRYELDVLKYRYQFKIELIDSEDGMEIYELYVSETLMRTVRACLTANCSFPWKEIA